MRWWLPARPVTCLLVIGCDKMGWDDALAGPPRDQLIRGEPMDQSIEQWRAVVGYEGLYEVSDLGNVRSPRKMLRKNTRGNPQSNSLYYYVALNNHLGWKKHNVHKLVLEAFVGPRPEGMEACHGPLGQFVNTVENLRWGTHSSNNLDKMRDGTATIGEKNGLSKLTEQDVRNIRAMRGKLVQAKLAAMYGVSQKTISWVHTGKVWNHVK